MKWSVYVAAFFFIGVFVWMPIAMAEPFETGWLKDEKGSVDPKTKATVRVVSNMHGTQINGGPMEWKIRYVGIEIPVTKIDPKKLIVIDKDGKFIRHTDAEAFEYSIDQKGAKGTHLKLFLEHQAGFSFRLRYNNP